MKAFRFSFSLQTHKFAGPGRPPAYFPCSSKESKQRKDDHLAVGTTVAVRRCI
jgi:hypothetical protein